MIFAHIAGLFAHIARRCPRNERNSATSGESNKQIFEETLGKEVDVVKVYRIEGQQKNSRRVGRPDRRCDVRLTQQSEAIGATFENKANSSSAAFTCIILLEFF